MTSLKGHLLIATPSLLDPNFVRTVLLIFDHNEQGAAGVVLNRATGATVADIAEEVLQEPFEWDQPIHLGGPVTGPLLALHTDGVLGDQEVMDGIYSTVDAAKLQQLIRGKVEPIRIVANYAGWGPGQLESEIAADSWLSCPARAEHVFAEAGIQLWERVVKEINDSRLAELLGIKERPDDPRLN